MESTVGKVMAESVALIQQDFCRQTSFAGQGLLTKPCDIICGLSHDIISHMILSVKYIL